MHKYCKVAIILWYCIGFAYNSHTQFFIENARCPNWFAIRHTHIHEQIYGEFVCNASQRDNLCVGRLPLQESILISKIFHYRVFILSICFSELSVITISLTYTSRKMTHFSFDRWIRNGLEHTFRNKNSESFEKSTQTMSIMPIWVYKVTFATCKYISEDLFRILKVSPCIHRPSIFPKQKHFSYPSNIIFIHIQLPMI